MKRHLLFTAAVALQCVILVGMGAKRAIDVKRGTRVTLAVVPVDPMDLFRGEYVRLSYPISNLETRDLRLDVAPREGEAFYLCLEERRGVWVPVAIAGSPGIPPPRRVWLRGTCTGFSGTRLHATYGIEKFFVEQGRGRQIEQAVRRGTVQAEFAVAEDGTATLTALIMDGKRIE